VPEVRWATEEDAPQLAAILMVMADHYRQEPIEPARALASARQWLQSGREEEPHFAMAFAGNAAVGLASVSIAYPGGNLARLLLLKDLFVTAGARGQGVGRALVVFLARYCRDNGIGRIDLSTPDWNTGAIAFYEGLGAVRRSEPVFLRFTADVLSKLVD